MSQDQMPIEQRYRVNTPKVVHETIDGEVVMIHLDTGSYYSLDGVGAAIWNRLDRGASLADIAAWLGQQYPDSQPKAAATVSRLVAALQAEDLIRPQDGTSVQRNRPPMAEDVLPAAFVVPVLNKHTDMQDLLLLDPIHEVDETGWPSVKKEQGS